MCFKYEEKYGSCFDYMESGEFGNPESNLLDFLFNQWDIKVNDNDKFLLNLFKFFEKMHEEGIMEPKL